MQSHFAILFFAVLLALGASFGFEKAMAASSDQPSSSSLLSNEEQLIRQKAKHRSYPGGNDEEPLKVQAQLPSASRKMQPAQEPVEVDEPVENHTNDSND